MCVLDEQRPMDIPGRRVRDSGDPTLTQGTYANRMQMRRALRSAAAL